MKWRGRYINGRSLPDCTQGPHRPYGDARPARHCLRHARANTHTWLAAARIRNVHARAPRHARVAERAVVARAHRPELLCARAGGGGGRWRGACIAFTRSAGEAAAAHGVVWWWVRVGGFRERPLAGKPWALWALWAGAARQRLRRHFSRRQGKLAAGAGYCCGCTYPFRPGQRGGQTWQKQKRCNRNIRPLRS